MERLPASPETPETTLSLVIRSLPFPAAILDSDGKIVCCSPALTGLLNADEPDPVGSLWCRCFAPALPLRLADRVWRQALAGEAGLEIETLNPHRRVGGNRVRWRLARVPGPARGRGAAVILAGTCRDEESPKEADRDELLERLELARKGEELGRIAGVLGHELNNVLGAILGFAELVQDGLREGRPCGGDVDEILSAALTGRELVAGLFHSRRRLGPRIEPVDLVRVLQSERSRLAWSPQLRIDFRREDGVPPVQADAGELRLLIRSLLRLLRPHEPAGSPVLTTSRLVGVVPNRIDSPHREWLVLEAESDRTDLSAVLLSQLHEHPNSLEPMVRSHPDVDTIMVVLRRNGGYLECSPLETGGTRWNLYLPACTPSPDSRAPRPADLADERKGHADPVE